jgi:hypothetical protein
MHDPAAKIRRLSHVLMVLCGLGIVVVALVYPLSWIVLRADSYRRVWQIPEHVPLALPGPTLRLLGFVVSGLFYGPILYGLAQLWLVLRQFGRGVLFDRRNVRRLRHIGWAIVAVAAGDIATQILVPFVLTFANPPDQRWLNLDFSDGDLLGIFAGGVMLLIARVLDAARAISEDNAQII